MFKQLVTMCFQRNPQDRPDARSLLSNVFFVEEHYLSDDEETCGRSLFSPGTRATPGRGAKLKKSPMRGTLSASRRKSVGNLLSPLMSPPIPRHVGFTRSPAPKSPRPDSQDWPTWAREKHEVVLSPAMHDSLAYSHNSKGSKRTSAGSTLLGLDFMESK